MKARPLLSQRSKTIEYDDSFVPELGVDVIFGGGLHWPGFLMFHESGIVEGFCWCEPDLKYDRDGNAIFEHRTTRN